MDATTFRHTAIAEHIEGFHDSSDTDTQIDICPYIQVKD